MKHSANRETTVKQADSKTDCNINRYVLMDKIYQLGEWFEKKAKQKRCVNSRKIYAMSWAVRSYKMAYDIDKDEVLDQLVKEIEAIKEHIGMET